VERSVETCIGTDYQPRNVINPMVCTRYCSGILQNFEISTGFQNMMSDTKVTAKDDTDAKTLANSMIRDPKLMEDVQAQDSAKSGLWYVA